MNKYSVRYNDNWIVSQRGNKNKVDHNVPYGWLVEKERTAAGRIEETGIIFLTNRECPFRCLMCDLWKNTTDYTIPEGAIASQIEWALKRMEPAKHLKLYNSGSFFDTRAIPENDYERIAELVSGFDTVIVESHPGFITDKCLKFRNLLKTELEIAVGLESSDPEILSLLNKKTTPEDFSDSISFLNNNNIPSRAFILLRPPFTTEEEGIEFAKRSIDFAFDAGVGCCVVIPVRSGNGAMEKLMMRGEFQKPDIRSLEEVMEYGIELNRGRVFGDTWDLGLFSKCTQCTEERKERIIRMNLTQEVKPEILCLCS